MNRVACTGCGRTDVPVRTFECRWPDARTTLERHCGWCSTFWQRQLRVLGARLREIGGAPTSPFAEPRANSSADG